VTSVASPVTWHVIVWILISLAINSMAQPSGHICGAAYRYRLYLSSSPIFCAVDALSAIIRLIATSICFRISPQKACCLVSVSRFEEYIPSTQSAPPPPPKPRPGPMSNSWPRYLFFIMGTLPASIKLASFTGNPWTKAWGFMFPSSFIIIELISFLSRWQCGVNYILATDPYRGVFNWSIPAVLDLSWEEWLKPQNKNLHNKATTLHFWMSVSDWILFILAFITHLIVLEWALATIWHPVVQALDMPDILNALISITLGIIVTVLIISVCTWICMHFTCYNTKGSFLNRFIIWWFKAFMIFSVIVPKGNTLKYKYHHPEIAPPKWVMNWNYKAGLVITPSFYLLVTYYISYCIIDWVGRRWPAVTKALLIENPGWKQVKEPAEPVTSGPLLKEPDDKRPDGPVDGVAFFFLFFFLTNLGICLGWYAVIYNPTGTVNPGWTDVFGR